VTSDIDIATTRPGTPGGRLCLPRSEVFAALKYGVAYEVWAARPQEPGRVEIGASLAQAVKRS
jgi:hypothetical protein